MDHRSCILRVNNLHTVFYTEGGTARAVNGVSFEVGEGDVVGIVGESGCGKSVTALSIMRLILTPPGEILSGEVLFNGIDLLSLPNHDMRRIRGKHISMIFQEPLTSLNPVMKIGDQIGEALKLHDGLSNNDARSKAIEMLRVVEIPTPGQIVDYYPHQLSGGMRQRVMFAMAFACGPRVILADEPTTALDVTVQAQMLDLMRKLRDESGAAIILITHNLGVIAEMAEKVIVMYTGRIVEFAQVRELFKNPLHPYTIGLLHAVTSLDVAARSRRLQAIPGIVPSLLELPQGCKFSDRCNRSSGKCIEEEPPLREIGPDHYCRCWLNH